MTFRLTTCGIRDYFHNPPRVIYAKQGCKLSDLGSMMLSQSVGNCQRARNNTAHVALKLSTNAVAAAVSYPFQMKMQRSFPVGTVDGIYAWISV